MDAEITIVKRETIPPVQAAEASGGRELGELRDFRWNEKLREFMPGPADLSVSWLRLMPGEQLPRRTLTVDSLIVVHGGSADLTGDLQRTVAAEDVVVVPSGCSYGLVGGPQGLAALAIQLGEARTSVPERQRSEDHLAKLLDYSRARLAQFEKRVLFELIADGALEEPTARAIYHDALRFWIARTGALLFVRQAGCVDAKYAQTFLLQTRDELDRGILIDNAVAASSLGYHAARDPILVAFADWFTRQMYVLDNVEKVAVVDLVVTSANAALGRTDAACRFWAQGHEEHLAETELLLRGESARTYERLHGIVAEAWDMIGAMTDRVAERICKKY
jgi:hypothetical protein